MITKRMVLEGDYVEAFLYFDFLWLFDNDGGVHAFDLETYVEKELNGSGNAARKLFARNDELVPRHPRQASSRRRSAIRSDADRSTAATKLDMLAVCAKTPRGRLVR